MFLIPGEHYCVDCWEKRGAVYTGICTSTLALFILDDPVKKQDFTGDPFAIILSEEYGIPFAFTWWDFPGNVHLFSQSHRERHP